jgi:aspartate aminotransferase-like enzyme
MAIADLQLPSRLLAGGGPSSPAARVLRALTTPLIGQFDPAFTAIMDEVAELGRRTFLTRNRRCLAVSGLASAGLEAVLNSVVEAGDRVAIGGSPDFVRGSSDIARRCGAVVVPLEQLTAGVGFVVVPFVDPMLATRIELAGLAQDCHARGASLIVEATHGLAACELRVDEWGVDVAVAGVDHAVGAPAGMALVTYTPAVEAHMAARRAPPRTSYLDLVQLQAYWSAERLNHHTAPTSLVYGLREALRLVHEEGLEGCWRRHRAAGLALRDGLTALGLTTTGDLPYSLLHLPASIDELRARQSLLDDFGIHVTQVAPRVWRLALLGAEAQPENVNRVLCGLRRVLSR